MALERIDLLENLRRLAPALGRDIVPVFACFCFTGKVATAYDDVVALSIPLPWPAPGGFRGDVLLGWLGAARAADVEVTAVEGKEGQALLKCGRSKLNITTLAPKDFVFSPQTDKADTIAITPGLLEMLGRCEVSMGEDPSRTWQNGVTLAFPSGDAPDRVTFYSTNNVAASRGRVKVTIERQTKLVTLLLPPRFVKLMLAIAARDKAKTLHVNKSWAQVDFASGLQLFSRTSRDTDLEAFKGVFNSELEAKAEKLLHEKPKGLEHALERALVLLASTQIGRASCRERV